MSAQDPTRRLPLPQRALAIVLGGDGPAHKPRRNSHRATPAAHFGGKFRTVDFALSNCLNSGIRRIGVVTPFRSHSLARHLERGWAFIKGEGPGGVTALPSPPPAPGGPTGTLGTAALLAQHLETLEHHRPEFVVVLAGDHICKMNYATMLADHVAQGRECTIACTDVPLYDVRAFRQLTLDAQGHPTALVDRPTQSLVGPAREGQALACMEIYVFNARYLFDALARDLADADSLHDLSRDIVARAASQGDAAAHRFALSCIGTAPGATPYWRNLATIDAYWAANIDLTATEPQLDLYDTRWPIRTHNAELPPVKFLHNEPGRRGMAVESLVASGSVISGEVVRSVLFPSVRVHSHASVEWSVLLPEVEVGRHARLSRVVVERGCTIPDGVVIGEDPVADAARFVRTAGGVTLVTADMLERLPGQPCVTS